MDNYGENRTLSTRYYRRDEEEDRDRYLFETHQRPTKAAEEAVCDAATILDNGPTNLR